MSQLSAVDLFRQAMAASRAGDKSKTRLCLLEAVRIDPNSETTWQWLAGVAETPLEATHSWEKVLQLNPNNEKAKAGIRPVRLQAGIDAAKAKDVPTAKRLLRAVVAGEPKNEHGWLWLASVSDTPVEAKAHLERVLYLNPQSKAARKGIEYYETKIAKQAAASAASESAHPKPIEVEAEQNDGDTLLDSAMPPPRRLPGEPSKALVVDGSRTYRKLIGMTLALEGFTLVEAEDADEAIDRIRDDGVPDFIVLDSGIAGLDAFEFCRLLRQHPDTESVPVVLLNGAYGQVEKSRSKNAGMTAVLNKPIHPETLLDAARQFCRVAAL